MKRSATSCANARTPAPPISTVSSRASTPPPPSQIHANDTPKLIRAIEVTLAARQPITRQWEQGRDPLTGFRILRLGLNPPRAELYARINHRAAEMFDRGLVEETTQLVERYGVDCRPLTSLGYAQAVAVLRGEITRDQAVAEAQQGHRNYAKRQLTWFRKDPAIHWLTGFGSDDEIVAPGRLLRRRTQGPEKCSRKRAASYAPYTTCPSHTVAITRPTIAAPSNGVFLDFDRVSFAA
jgi:hypothetical protein